MKTSLKVIACMAALAVLIVVQSAVAQGKLQGVWKITEVTYLGPTPRTYTIDPSGDANNLLIFTKGHFSFIGIATDKPRPDLPQKDATDAQKLAAWTPVVAYSGTYEVKGTIIRFHPTVSKDPRQMRPDSFSISDYSFEGDTLILTSRSNQDGPLPNPHTMKHLRLE
jgi:hypothetical protein